ncbi:MAG: M81 family metallopeptidase [Burkholderiaceae bacterium]
MPKRVLIAGFKHETNTFSNLPTDIAAYRARALHYDDEIQSVYSGTNTEIGGFLGACAEHGWEAVPSVVADATPSGKVTREAYDAISRHIFSTIEASEGLDAVLLQLHGAMVCEGRLDGQADLLAEIRSRVGSEVPIAVTLDLHANVSDRLASLCDIMVSYRSYPHTDQGATGSRCAALLARTLAGEIRPAVMVGRSAQLDGVDHGRTTSPGPMLDALTLGDHLCEQHGFYACSVNAGFPWADVVDSGPSVVIVAERQAAGFPAEVEAALTEVTDFIWRTRTQVTIQHTTAAAAIAAARKQSRLGAPYVIADFADNPGGGGYGDSTGLLRAMIDSDLQDAAFSALFDPHSVKLCQQAGVGARIALELGGKCSPVSGSPVSVQADIEGLFDGTVTLMGPMSTGVKVSLGEVAVVKVGGVRIVLATQRAQNYDRQFFEAFGIETARQQVLAVKSAQHFRADYGPIASGMAVVDEGGGICSHQLQALDYQHVRRPIWPLDPMADA